MTTSSSPLDQVRQVVARLLDPEAGCPWDKQQTPATLRLYLLEETYELMEAIESGSEPDVLEEMGDCLFILTFLARLYQDGGHFSLDDALKASARKMIARHPHIFGDAPELDNADAVRRQWHQLKRREKDRALLAGVPKSLPALLRSHRLTERAGKVGFDWPTPGSVIESIDQEMDELRQAMQNGDPSGIESELGDVLFTVANLARHLKVNAENALRSTNEKFADRFGYIEKRLSEQGLNIDEASLEQMDELWAEAKKKGL